MRPVTPDPPGTAYLSVVFYPGPTAPHPSRDIWRRANLPDGWRLRSTWTGGEYEPRQANFAGPTAGIPEARELLRDATAAALHDGHLADYTVLNRRGAVLYSAGA